MSNITSVAWDWPPMLPCKGVPSRLPRPRHSRRSLRTASCTTGPGWLLTWHKKSTPGFIGCLAWISRAEPTRLACRTLVEREASELPFQSQQLQSRVVETPTKQMSHYRVAGFHQSPWHRSVMRDAQLCGPTCPVQGVPVCVCVCARVGKCSAMHIVRSRYRSRCAESVARVVSAGLFPHGRLPS